MAVDRCVLLVDAGYLFAQGGLACHGTKARQSLNLDPNRLIQDLTKLVTDHCKLPILRTYWYDGAKQGIPTAEHHTVAKVPYVKLRMGRISGAGQQKGVDALIYRDLMTLATERAVTEAYLLSGDDDLREGMIFAQDRGMRVNLLGIAHNGRTNQSQEMAYEADDRLTIDLAIVRAALTMVPVQPELALTTDAPPATPATPFDAGKSYAKEWLSNATEDAQLALVSGRPKIPSTLDIDLIRSAELALGRSLRGESEDKKKVRSGFWTGCA